MQMRQAACKKAPRAGTLETALPVVIKENGQDARLDDSTATADCTDVVFLACSQCSIAHMTETLIKCQAYKAAIKGFFFFNGEGGD